MAGVALLVAAASALAFAIGAVAGAPVAFIYVSYISNVLIFGTPATIAWAAALTIYFGARGVKSPFAELKRIVVDRLGTRNAALGAVGPILLLPMLMGAFGTLKQFLPLVTSYTWDTPLAWIGRALFFGIPPWRITHAIFGPRATQIFDILYAGWVPLLFLMVLGVPLLAKPRFRAQFVVAFTGCWLILGVLGAFLFPSVGPCFAALIGAPDGPEFAPLLARLHEIDQSGYPLVSLAVQRELWATYASHSYGFGMGISAMPSMHNSIAFLYVLAAGNAKWPVKILAWVFAVAILIASVHLGWHYLSDGLLAWLATAWIWQASARYLRWCGYDCSAEQATHQPARADRPLLA